MIVASEVADIWDQPSAAGGAEAATNLMGRVALAAARLAPKGRSTPKHAKPSACHPGLSYNPQTKDHQDVVAAAVAVELSRNEAEAEKDELWSRALAAKAAVSENPVSDEVCAIKDNFVVCVHNKPGLFSHARGMLFYQEESESDEESNEVAKRENRGKLTRAERNRQARHRQSLMLQRQAKRNKTLLNQIEG
jgi:hypothetical protein